MVQDLSGDGSGPSAAASGRPEAPALEQQLTDAGVQLWLDDTGVLHCIWPAHHDITAPLARLAVARAAELAGDHRYPLLVSLIGIHRISRATYAEWAAQTAANRVALLGRTPVDRVIADFAIGLTDLPLPVRYFEDESAALQWLRNPPHPDDSPEHGSALTSPDERR